MKKRLPLITILVLSLAAFGCGDGGGNEQAAQAQAESDHAGHDHPAAQSAATTPGGVKAGKVIETMDAGSYTYVHVDCGGEQIWAAAPQRAVEVGSEVSIDTRMPMPNFRSETLDRTFDVVYFTNGFGETAPAGHDAGMGGGVEGMHPEPKPAADIDLTGIAPAEGGKTVAAIWAERTDLAGKQVTVRGKVVKYNANIMGKNWLHVRDGSGQSGTDDLTVTTQGFAQVGDLVTVTGKVAIDRDFGAGYSYEVILEDATVVKK